MGDDATLPHPSQYQISTPCRGRTPTRYNPFPKGSKIEVRTNDKDFKGVYFTANVLRSTALSPKNTLKRRSRSLYVEYDNLLAHADGADRLKEHIELSFCRPSPPPISVTKPFEPDDIVDAFYRDGWWPGVVTRVIGGGERYVVTFSCPPDEQEFALSDLRVHSDWVRGNWVRPQKQKKSRMVACLSLTKGGKHASVSQNALSQPTGKEEADIDKTREQDTLDRSAKDTIYSSVSPISVINKSSSASQTDTSWGKRTRRSQNANEKVKNYTPSSVNGNRAQTSELKYPSLNVGAKEPDALRSFAAIQHVHAKNNAEANVILGLPCAEIGNLEYATKVKGGGLANIKEMKYLTNDKKRQLIDSTAHKMKDNKILGSEEQPQRRKRGRPKKIPLDGIHSPGTGNAHDGVVCSGYLTGTSEDSHRIPEVEKASLSNPEMTINNNKSSDGNLNPKNENGGKRKRTLSKMHSEKSVQESVRLQGAHSSRRGRRLMGGGALQVTVDDSGGKMKEANKAMEIGKEVCEALNKDFDDEPLSKWIEGIQSPPSSNVSKPSHATYVNQCLENGTKKGDIVVHTDSGDNQPESGENTPALVATGSIVPSERENLPFVKNTVLWQTIESMEVFRRMPQRPHFKPLEDFTESSQEGLAIGYMVTFSSVVERTCRLWHDDPESVTDDIMRTLTDLERHGFDVKVVRDCITKCLKLRKLQNQIVDEVKMLKDRTLEHKQEFSGVEEELKQLQEKIALAEAAKERVSGEITSLEAEMTGCEEMMKKLGSDFQTVASSLLQ